MGKLLYHSVDRSRTDFSPFDDAILKVSRAGEARIISPYIGISYLERIIEVASDWSLISDVEAWLSSLSVRARPRAWTFIRENIEKIHHCAGIHAKAVIGESLAMLGSANLTSSGIQSRTELGILLSEPRQIAELQQWFSGLWSQTVPPFVDETSAFIEWLDDEAAKPVSQRQKFALAPETKMVRAKLIRVENKKMEEKQTAQSPALDLGAVAQEIVVQEDRRYSSIGDAVENAIDILASRGFTLGQIVSVVRQSVPRASAREVYLLLLQHCANHPRSVFVESTVNRLIVSAGIFTQSDAPRLANALNAFDIYLVALVRAVRFDGPADLPSEADLATESGIDARDQLILISELLDAGFFEMLDLPGELPKYELAEDFDWAGRFRLFTQAKHAWDAMHSKPRNRVSPSPQRIDCEDDEDEDEEEVPSFVEEQRLLRQMRLDETKKDRKNLIAAESAAYRMLTDKLAQPPISLDADAAQAKVLEYVLSSPDEHWKIPIKKPGRAVSALGVPVALVNRILFGNPNNRVLEVIPVKEMNVRFVVYKPLPEFFLAKLPKTREVLVRFGKLAAFPQEYANASTITNQEKI